MTQEERTRAMRARLLEATVELLVEKGYAGTSTTLVSERAGVSRGAQLHHFPSKQDLVVSYLRGIHDTFVERAAAHAATVSGRDLVAALRDDVIAEIGHPNFRGCAFINAASEFEDPQGSVRLVVAAHRRWYYDLMRRAFAEAGHVLPANAARHFLMLRDGAVTAGYLDSTTAAQRTFKRGVEGLLRSIDMEPSPDDDS